MINANSVAYSVFTTIASDQFVVGSGYHVDLHEPMNTDPNRQPWVGVYMEDVDVTPGQMNISAPWHVEYIVSVLVQESSHESAEKANDRVLRALNPVLTAVNSNRTLDNTVLHITEIRAAPFQRSIVEDNWMFVYEIEIKSETTQIPG